ncbi:hypothetical protein FHS95_002517 [Sphingomonas naasensis]|uniref:Uncharacterized protein n=1 Tax=Sphingomonas naasensis TaxID=1344951 RepID=A0A4S1WMN1_9SPHN|nr:hypothetical protein [Sphingomonas naasensis]NIJ20825.1 hypothetical protein [Sphingomonas naasensis]TGX43227.1 hypothetical protein E5A74_08630 [Sphingomonas naasensis]
MNLRDVSNASAINSAFTATLTLTVDDAEALWNAAAEKALQAGMALSDVLDTIGPREDPAIGDCLAMLLVPAGVAGCALDDFAVDATPIATAEIIPMPLTRAASR